ncbi:hypothetical protein [Aurantibacillus circumpalustris]|uniref:hypothetical protein n=1 Tax=Aurantibacillus circumpalustris TaxID=3036359 RepID=UPI00295BC014|nr:hypothetical protein [Aurantibacillus circumpalustris]
MQIFKALSLTALLSIGIVNSELQAQANTAITTPLTPAKTIILKHPLATNADNFFSAGTAFMFEIYKVGDISKVIELIKKNSNVSECTAGITTGDYQQINILLKVKKDKAWFADLFKKAGLKTIKINNNPIVEVEKM